jgi:hypothetical protein
MATAQRWAQADQLNTVRHWVNGESTASLSTTINAHYASQE